MTRHTKRSSRRRKRGHSSKRRSRYRSHRGAGWSDNPSKFIAGAPGYVIHQQYGGPGKDCTGNVESNRPGHIGTFTPGGLPGYRGGSRGGRRRRKRGGAAMPAAATYEVGKPVYDSITPLPKGFPETSGVGGTVGQPSSGQYGSVSNVPGGQYGGSAPVVYAPVGGVIPNGAKAPNSTQLIKQAGGRYGSQFFPLNPQNGVGLSSYTPTSSIPCERGTYNELNPNPRGIQTMSTLPMRSQPMTGGANLAHSAMPYGGGVVVGASDSKAYYAPTAGYGHAFETYRAPNPVPGLMINTPYEARAFNQACIKTGGGRRHSKRRRSHSRSRGGAQDVAYQAGEYRSLTTGEIGSTKDFDNRIGVPLPAKIGGRRTHRKYRSHR
jgi:hypothetical protein